ncbi:MAG: Outer membrane efflux protein BepC [Candidatus Ordinivivax streblomastigis]|uniref:Outer membrane efflux protein BepC n=1 Tax=Candidatus Ordinivivax streblomastigis TaxID=2540710 RepID=A0A5M8P2E2_9BACT|nr:MAG: Outer membrane efflux protein BepC [Candidatus Ordinivivax streblomastigis]
MKHIHLFFAQIVSAFLFASTLQAQEIYTLKRVLETGLERNYDIRIIRNEQQISDNNTTWGNAGLLPTVDVSGGYDGSLATIDQFRTDTTNVHYNHILNQRATLGLNLNWTVFDGFKMQTEYSRLKEFQRIGEIQTRIAIENLMASLTAEYYDHVRQTLRLKNLKYAVSLSKERLRIVEARYNIGSLSRLDLQQARVDFNADSSRLIQQYERLNTSTIVLNHLMAVDDVSQKWTVGDTAIVPNILPDKHVLWDKTKETNTQLLLSEKNKSLSRLDLKAFQSRNLPYVTLNAGYGYTLNGYDTDNSTINRQTNLGFTYGLTLGYTLFDGMNRQREQKNARISLQNRDLEHQRLELALQADLTTLWMAYQNNLELTGLEKENLSTAHENYEIAIERYLLGDLSGIELREAQNSLLEAEERLLEAQYNTKLCEVSLLQISGQLANLF